MQNRFDLYSAQKRRALGLVGSLVILMLSLGLQPSFAQGPPTIGGITWTQYNFVTTIPINGTNCTITVNAFNAGTTGQADCDWYINGFCTSCNLTEAQICEVMENIVSEMIHNNPQADPNPPDCLPNHSAYLETKVRVPRCMKEDASNPGCYNACSNEIRCDYTFKTCILFDSTLYVFDSNTLAVRPNDDCPVDCTECECAYP